VNVLEKLHSITLLVGRSLHQHEDTRDDESSYEQSKMDRTSPDSESE